MPRRAIPADPSIGQRVRARRDLKGWTLRHAASVAGLAPSTWSRIENGEVRADRYSIAEVAAALECSIVELTGQPHRPADRTLELAHTRVQPLWLALLEVAPDEPPARPQRPVEQLTARAELVTHLRMTGDYAGAAGLLPDLLADVHAACTGPHTAAALRMMVDATHNALLVVRHLGYSAEPALAAERCRQAAERLDEAVPLALADWARAHIAFTAGAFTRALTLTGRNIDTLGARVSDDGLPVLGLLHLTAAVAILADRVDVARDHVAEAARLAQRTGETAAWGLGFGPSNVAVWGMTVEVDAGEPGRALGLARQVDVAALSRARGASYYVEMARALTDVRRDREAVRMMLAGERTAPQLVRSSTAARESTRYLLHRARRATGGSELRGLAERLGVAA